MKQKQNNYAAHKQYFFKHSRVRSVVNSGQFNITGETEICTDITSKNVLVIC